MIEKTIVETLRLACAADAWFGAQPQADDEAPSRMPVILVNRVDATWFNNFCGLDDALALTAMQVDYYDETAEGARRLADTGRVAMRDLSEQDDPTVRINPTLEGEATFYDSVSRAWRIMQNWLVTDYAPALPPVTR